MATKTRTETPKTTKRKSTSAGRRRTPGSAASEGTRDAAVKPAKAPKAAAAAPKAVAGAAVAAAASSTEPTATTALKSGPHGAEEITMAKTMSARSETDAGLTEPTGADANAADDRLRRPDLIEAIAARVSLKRAEAKMVFDVVLDEIGKALDASDEVVVPPLGKFMVKKRDIKRGGPMLTLKLKRADAAPLAGDVPPLADPDEDS